MKRLANNFFAAAKATAFFFAAMVAFSACVPENQKEDPSVQVSQTEVTADANGTTADVTVTANVAWTAVAGDKWVTVAPAEGEAGENKVTITVKKNNADTPRETKVTITAETAIAEVTVSQFGKDNITIDKTAYEATPAGGTDAVAVTANVDWTATVEEGADWVTVAPASGAAGSASATVTVAANATSEERSAKITFVAGEAKAEYTVTQEGLSIALSQATVTAAGEGATATVSVTANAAWSASVAEDVDWVTLDPATGEAGEVEVTVTVAENPTEEARNATVTFAINENVSVELAISQAFVEPTVDIAIEVSDVTATKALVKLTPDPLEGFTYYYDIMPKETADILFETDEQKIDYIVSGINEQLEALEGVLTWADIVSEGEDEYLFDGLDPVTEYYVLAFGIDGTGTVTSDLFEAEFKTNDFSPALKQWIGTWNLTSSDTYESVKGAAAGLTGKPSKRVITISTESVFGLPLEETDLVVAGLSYTDAYPLYSYTDSDEAIPMETVGTVNENGDLELKNEFEVGPYGDMGTITWYGNGYIGDKKYYISGDYPPFTLSFGADKNTATGNPAVLNTSAGECVIAYYDIMFVGDAGASSLYTTEGCGALSGTWTLEKVEEEPAAAPQAFGSKKIMTRVEKQIKAENAKVMKQLNSNYLYQPAQAL